MSPCCRFCLLLLLFAAPLRPAAQCYRQLFDVTGINTDPFQSSLEAAACELRDALPEEFRRDFGVFSCGFYVLQQDFKGFDYPDAFTRAQDAIDKPYYLIFGRQSDPTGIYTRFYVALKLPMERSLGCLNKPRVEALKAKIDRIVSVKLESVFAYADTEVAAMKSLREAITKILDCCAPNFRTSVDCTLCPDPEEIKDVLLARGFLGVPCKVKKRGSVLSAETSSLITDFSSTDIEGVSAVSVLTSFVSSMPLNNPKGYITDNEDYCAAKDFQFVSDNFKDADIWVHIWESQTKGEGMVFVLCNQYITASDDFPALTKDGRESVSDGWMIVDIIKEKFYKSATLRPLPLEYYESTTPPDDGNGPPTYTVKQGESLSSIAIASNGAFTVADLLRWNKISNPNDVKIGQVLSLFVEEYWANLADDQHVWGINIPLSKNISTGFVGDALRPLSQPIVKVPAEPLLPEKPDGKSPYPKNPNINPWPAIRPLVRISAIVAFVLTPVETGGSASPLKDQERVEILYGRPHIEYDDPGKNQKLKYVTYTKTNLLLPNDPPLKNGKVYVGYSRGQGSPDEIVRNRDYGHKILTGFGYGKACLDRWAYATKPKDLRHDDPSYKFIRGREQLVIEDLGGSITDTQYKTGNGRVNAKLTRAGNSINAINRSRIDFYTASMALARAFSFPPGINWDGVCP